jgi:V/A-type H+/Na+-transporting ATPase subunit E
MENKLQELTEKIYAEGVDKANKEAEEIIAKANEEVENMKGKQRRRLRK